MKKVKRVKNANQIQMLKERRAGKPCKRGPKKKVDTNNVLVLLDIIAKQKKG